MTSVLAFPEATYRDRLAKVRSAMREASLDVLIVCLPDNIYYLSGFDTIGYLWFQALVIGYEDDPILLTRTTELPGAALTSWVSDVVGYDIEHEDPVEIVARLVGNIAGLAATVGVELDAFTLLPSQWERLRRSADKASFVDASMLVVEVRLHKDELELKYQVEAGNMANLALEQALGELRPGITEVAFAGIISSRLGELGSEYAAIPPMVASGPRSPIIHGMATRREIEANEPVIIELAAVSHRYHAVLMRTASLGEPPRRVTEAAAVLAEAMDAAVAAAGPGQPAGAPNAACNAILDRAGLAGRRAHRIGYSLGIAYPPTWLEAMMLVDDDPHIIEPSMSFTLEPNLTLLDEGFGLKLGETVVCTADGSRSLATAYHGLLVIG
jgi:Xaa-Pro dipeptidase